MSDAYESALDAVVDARADALIASADFADAHRDHDGPRSLALLEEALDLSYAWMQQIDRAKAARWSERRQEPLWDAQHLADDHILHIVTYVLDEFASGDDCETLATLRAAMARGQELEDELDRIERAELDAKFEEIVRDEFEE